MYTLGIEAFLAIVRTQSLSRAAEKLHLAQSSVSHRLKILEEMMGATLIDRGKGIKEISLTPMGAEFLQLAERWNSLWLETQILKSQGPKLSLSFGAVNSLNTFVFPPLFSAMTQHQPPVILDIHTLHSIPLYEELEKGQIHVGFALREQTLPGVNVERFLTVPMVVLRLGEPSDSNSKLINPNELDPNYELYIPWGPLFQIWHDRWWNPLCLSRIKLESAQLLFTLLQHPLQWAIVPMWIAKSALKEGKFSYYKLSDPPPDIVCYKLTHKYPKPSTLQSLTILDHYLDLLITKDFY
ncbi:LysR family transcriptional regulator [Pelosinus sp. UFO1]|uniref:LysR family transcriptional regulator n=1 Tax=Pelosinus sp. UFO1 TaxID=484770 RepID=UPI0004D1CB6B|nr:LysR family transcriptional regulator [Pelosinus sp. UFO1]AIF53486.1 transcriptional regulator, LysR family [Pelosinus sp. UFO1]